MTHQDILLSRVSPLLCEIIEEQERSESGMYWIERDRYEEGDITIAMLVALAEEVKALDLTNYIEVATTPEDIEACDYCVQVYMESLMGLLNL